MMLNSNNHELVDIYVEHVVVDEESVHAPKRVVRLDSMVDSFVGEVLEDKESEEDNSIQTMDSEYSDYSECDSFFGTDEEVNENGESRFVENDAQHDWPKTKYDHLLAPLHKKMPGRPKKQRRREDVVVPKPNRRTISKIGQIITSSICRKQGHNKATCSNISKIPHYLCNFSKIQGFMCNSAKSRIFCAISAKSRGTEENGKRSSESQASVMNLD